MSMSAPTSLSLRVKAPSRKFSSDVMSAMMRRPSITWMMPRRTILSGSTPSMRSLPKTIRRGDFAVFGLEQSGDASAWSTCRRRCAEQGNDRTLRYILLARAAQMTLS